MRLPGAIRPDWDAPANVRAVSSTRGGGASAGPYASLNLGDHVGDLPGAVHANRERLARVCEWPGDPVWLDQVHGADVYRATSTPEQAPRCDAAVAVGPGRVCAVLTADCLPVLLSDSAGGCVAASHAGWRGLAAGVLEATVAAMPVPAGQIMAWLGPAIGPDRFEVGDEVRAAFVSVDPGAEAAFRANDRGRWMADLYLLARRRLAAAGVTAVSGGGYCTFEDEQRFFSYRRDGITGRMATLIWLAS